MKRSMFVFLLFNFVQFLYVKSLTFPTHRSFLKNTYQVKDNDKQVFRVRQVPGDGGCLFHSIAASISYSQTNSHQEFDSSMLQLSYDLRKIAVSYLQQNLTLIYEKGEIIDSATLLQLVSNHYNMTEQQYCANMLKRKAWGGGPEIIAISNHMKCPIYVYQLCTKTNFLSKTFAFELLTKFGSPNFDAKTPIYLLCADSR